QKYMKRMAFTFNEIFSCRISFDTRLEALSLYLYDDQIKAQEEEHKINDCILFDFYEQELKSVGAYVNALERVNSINTLESYLNNHIMPVVADWPRQIFIRKVISLRLQDPNNSNIPDIALFFIPVIGALHMQLNL
ncbi:23377_t:CDS:2, partial [Racocetra persica]